MFFGPTQCNGKFIYLSYQVNPNLVASLSIFYEWLENCLKSFSSNILIADPILIFSRYGLKTEGLSFDSKTSNNKAPQASLNQQQLSQERAPRHLLHSMSKIHRQSHPP